MSEAKLREYKDHGNSVEAWWFKREGGKNVPIKSKDLQPVRLPVGQASSLASLFRRLPKP